MMMCSAAGDVKFLQNVENKKASAPTSEWHRTYICCIAIVRSTFSPSFTNLVVSPYWTDDETVVVVVFVVAVATADVFSVFFVPTSLPSQSSHLALCDAYTNICISVFWACAVRSSNILMLWYLYTVQFLCISFLLHTFHPVNPTHSVLLVFNATTSCNFSISCLRKTHLIKIEEIPLVASTSSKCAP